MGFTHSYRTHCIVVNDHVIICVLVQVWVASLEHSRVNTCSLYASPTGLSPYLRFGCLSCRVLYYNLRELYMKVARRRQINSHQSGGVVAVCPGAKLVSPLAPLAAETLQPSTVPVWPVVVEGVLLHGRHQQPKFRPYGGESNLCPGASLFFSNS